MKNLILSFLTITLLTNKAVSQDSVADRDKKIYKYLINFIDQNQYNHKPIFYKTSIEIFKRVNFKTVNLIGLDSISICAWRPFLSQINFENLHEQTLMLNIKSHSSTDRQNIPCFTFSPISYSKDKNMAACLISDYDNPEAGSETLILISLQGEELKVIKWVLISIS